MSTAFKTRTQLVAEALREQILSGAISAGEPLRQDAIAKSFNVSRIPVREALLQLEAQGLVHFEPHKGAIATELSIRDISELFSLRALLEGEILGLAIDQMNSETLIKAKNICKEYHEVLQDDEQVERWSRLNQKFHATLYTPADQPLTMQLIDSLNTKCDRYIRLQLLLTDGIEKAEQEHEYLLNLCQEGKKQEAVQFLQSHILEAGQAIRNRLANML
ncbi:GntR family transcriptional regulator [Algicola sagamiensis]|uniref:GntR family transcriptional regulator n=1 Tax=Algicola sagamiensis TaxID=163869 RepID=UPI00036A7520|nr:GntR family transcriptional regulator [Algicola sagamiensis]